MAAVFPPDFPSELEGLIREQLRPGEQLLAVLDMHTQSLDSTIGGGTFVITNERLYSFTFSRRLFGRRVELAGVNDVRLSQLGNVSHGYEKKMFGPSFLNIELRWNDGRYDHLYALETDASKRFLEVLRDAHDRSHVSGTGQVSVAEQLSKLAELKEQGLLDDGDWERAKDLFLGKPSDKREEAITNLRQLHGLHRSGVLSESEFNMKKWDVLSRS